MKDEHVLFTLWGPEPASMLTTLQTALPGISASWARVDATDNFVDVITLSDMVPDEEWKRATVLVTVFALPKNVELVPNLKYVHFYSAGLDHFKTHPFFTAATATMTTSTGIAAPPIAEHAVMTLLSLTKRFPMQLSWQRSHTWGPKAPFLASIGDWVGKTVGIAGYGSIGRHTARILSALGAKIHAYTATPRETQQSKRDKNYCVPGTGDPDGVLPTRWFSGTGKEVVHTFLGSGLHALVLSLPLTEHTRHMLGREEFEVLQQTSPFAPSSFDPPDGPPAGAFVVNMARGAIVNQDALVEALKNRVIHGAALDVADPEPLPAESELWDLENCIVTPHTSGIGSEYSVRGFELLLANLHKREKGEEMWNVVTKGRGY